MRLVHQTGQQGDCHCPVLGPHCHPHTTGCEQGEDQGWGGWSQEEVKEDRGQAIKVLGNLDKGRFQEEAE